MIQAPEQMKVAADAASLGTVIAAWLGALSAGLTVISTLLAIGWMLIRIYETETVQKYLKRRKT